MKEYSIDMGKFKHCGDNSQTICFLPMIHLWQTTKARRSHSISGFSPTNSQFFDTESCRRGGKLWTRSMQAAVRSSHMRRWDIWYIYYHIWGGEINDIYVITYEEVQITSILAAMFDTHTKAVKEVVDPRCGYDDGGRLFWSKVYLTYNTFNIVDVDKYR